MIRLIPNPTKIAEIGNIGANLLSELTASVIALFVKGIINAKKQIYFKNLFLEKNKE
jgi:hypothetical protein